MKALDEAYRDLMYLQRRSRALDFEGVAILLNAEKRHMVDAQIGKPIPDEVYDRLIDWLELD